MTQPKREKRDTLPYPVELAGQILLAKGKTGMQYPAQALSAVREGLARLSQKLHDSLAENTFRGG